MCSRLQMVRVRVTGKVSDRWLLKFLDTFHQTGAAHCCKSCHRTNPWWYNACSCLYLFVRGNSICYGNTDPVVYNPNSFGNIENWEWDHFFFLHTTEPNPCGCCVCVCLYVYVVCACLHVCIYAVILNRVMNTAFCLYHLLWGFKERSIPDSPPRW